MVSKKRDQNEDFNFIQNASASLEVTELDSTQELLILRYFDQECGWFERFKARRLLARSQGAREFLSFMSDVSRASNELNQSHRLGAESGESFQINLWQRISARIEQEERSALFLGERVAVSREPRSAEDAAPFWVFNLESLPKVGWGVTGAAAMAVFLLAFQPVFVRDLLDDSGSLNVAGLQSLDSSAESVQGQGSEQIPSNELSRSERPTILRSATVAPIQTVASGSQGESRRGVLNQPRRSSALGRESLDLASQYRELDRNDLSGLELDWIDSHGSVSFHSVDSGDLPVIIIKRDRESRSRYARERSLLRRVEPSQSQVQSR